MSTEEQWDEYLESVRRYLATGKLDRDEIDYKLTIGRKLEAARSALLADDDGWFDRLKPALSGKGHPMDWRDADHLKKWLNNHREAGCEALGTVWSDGDLKPGDIRAFSKRFPSDAGPGTARVRLRTISVLLMALGPDRYPPYMATRFDSSFRRLSYDGPPADADEETTYRHALAFLDELVARAKARGLDRPANRLEAQSIVYVMHWWPETDGNVVANRERQKPNDVDHGMAPLAEELYLPVDFLQNIETLLREKKQVIFQGPPGTGKTYVAQRLARHLAGGDQRCQLVQFHPSYSYEDFVRGYRPKPLADGQPGFTLRDGPFLRIARQAKADLDGQYFLIIDEINRGNLAKVFGELYFLLEYRETPMKLMYQEGEESPFTMPGNLYIVGTMNTADRSIAPVDLALRRRFAFVDFSTNKEPVKSLLRGWLRANGLDAMDWVADVVERANAKLDDRHAAIGPSYFMRRDLDDAAVERIWEHGVLPYIEEHLFGEHDRLGEFALDRLRRSGDSETREQEGSGAAQDAGGDGDARD